MDWLEELNTMAATLAPTTLAPTTLAPTVAPHQMTKREYKIHGGYSAWLPVAWIPNTTGYKIIALTNTGEWKTCTVARGADGCHYLEGIDITTIKGWKPYNTGGMHG